MTEVYIIEVNTDNPNAAQHLRDLCEDTLKGVDIDADGGLHEATISLVARSDDRRVEALLGFWHLDPD